MRLLLTENQKFLIRFEQNSEIEVFSLNPIQPQFSCKGRILGFSRDSSLMLVWNEHYQVYDLAQGIAFSIQEANRADFAPEVLLDLRGTGKPDRNMQAYDVISNLVMQELAVPEETGIARRFASATKIIGSTYGVLNLFYMNGLGEGYEGIESHIFDLSTGEFQIKIGFRINHYQPKHNRLLFRIFNGAILLEFNEQINLTSVIPWRFNKNFLPRFWPVSAIASFPENRNQLAFAREHTVYIVDILPPEEHPEDLQQISHYETSISTEIKGWGHINALCIDDSGRYLYMSYNNEDIDIFDMQANDFSEQYKLPYSKKIFGR